MKAFSAIRLLSEPRLIVTFFLGFSSGLPLLATGSTLQALMTDQKVSLAAIGVYSLVGLPYILKFLWAPFLDQFAPPFLGRRRGWMIVSQLAVLCSLAALGQVASTGPLWLVGAVALLVAFFSATQDIVLDAHRRDTLSEEELGLGTAVFVAGYRIGILVSGAFALMLADLLPWEIVYLIISAFMLIGMVATMLASEPECYSRTTGKLRERVIEPFIEFLKRPEAGLVLCFIVFYKLGDSLASSMTTPFILQLGFSKTELAVAVKTYGLVALIGGGLVGGLIMVRTGIARALWLFGFLQAVSILTFVLLAHVGHDMTALVLAVSFENLSFGMGTAAFGAFVAQQCNRQFSATQYALLSSFISIPRVLLSAQTGYLATYTGWPAFFLLCTVMALPGMLLLLKVAPWQPAVAAAGQSGARGQPRSGLVLAVNSNGAEQKKEC